MARLYDSTSSLGWWMFMELWMVGVPRCRERMLPSSEIWASGRVWRKKRERRNGWVMRGFRGLCEGSLKICKSCFQAAFAQRLLVVLLWWRLRCLWFLRFQAALRVRVEWRFVWSPVLGLVLPLRLLFLRQRLRFQAAFRYLGLRWRFQAAWCGLLRRLGF